MSDTDQIERHGFGAEVGRLLDLVVHSLYSDREIFLRELVANAADATDRRRFEALTDPAMAPPEQARLRIVPDKAARTLTIADDGIGMTKDELGQNLGTIARSGTRAFGQALETSDAAERPSLIGQFGVGFYAAFMVAVRVTVTSRRAGGDQAWAWESDGRGEYTLAPASREQPGTDVVLQIKADADEFLEPVRLDAIVRKWADHIAIPIVIAQPDGTDQAANEGTALWRKPKAEITDEALQDFYRHLGNFFDTPWATLQWRAEGTIEFAALLFIPGMKPFEVVEGDRASHVRLHVKRMFITDDANLLPSWLRFVQGVVDTEDLPLNVSREMLQTTPVLARIRKAVTGRVLGELRTKSATDDYAKFWDNFGPVLKEGVWEDGEHRAELAGLLRFRSSQAEGLVSLAEYAARMPEGQPAIYYLAGDDAAALAGSPQLEGFRARGWEVLLLSDSIDAFWPERMGAFQDKKLRSVTQASADLGETAASDATLALVARIKSALGERVSDVRATGRLADSAVVLAASARGPDLQMQRLLRRTGRDQMGGRTAPVLEVNAAHPLIAGMGALDDAGLGSLAQGLLDLAHIQDGELPDDPTGFARRMTALLAAKEPA